MKDLFILAATVAAFIFGWFLTGKICALIERDWKAHRVLLSDEDSTLRIGFFDPLSADSLSDVLAAYSKAHPGVSICLFSGTEAELTEELSRKKLDMAFLPKNATVPERALCAVDEVSLTHTPVRLRYGGLVIAPITEGAVEQKLVWRKTEPPSAAGSFVRCLKQEEQHSMETGSGM